ncbi:arsenic resistance protein [Halomonas heilongjiangensis]|uniref:Bile acid:sodium symporter n=1 Tax=Halomonas heilongjiangensis TaxID=1387883 RepID=A0A2N7TFV6_9GAMM|nr:arsenic resistance protein [Halomonas heilongjiangensis]PMR67073.1 bile acid:sodium symporter [Halomonas heilongjiangensis]PXX87810.1 bile acid:sodium symporter [Halomonas heilongjiangensis]
MRDRLEKYQVFLYLAAVLAGLAVGTHSPGRVGVLEALLWPLLGLLLYATFTQVPLVGLHRRLANARFLAAAVLGNFVVIPPVVWGLVQWLPADPALRLGVLLVLLVPCTDWFLSFTHLGGGDTPTAIAFTPLSLLLQLVLLPLYLWLFLGQAGLAGLIQRELLLAFGGLILLPLAAAFISEHWAGRAPRRRRLIEGLGWLPIPLLALVLFAVAAGQVDQVVGAPGLIGWLLPVFVAFLIIAALLARLMAWAFRLPAAQGRVLAFSFGSRNSFVVLPLALALPAGLEAAVIVVVVQSLVELFGMLLFLWLVPRRLFPMLDGRDH